MDPTDSDATRIPAGNVRVPRDEFVTLWREALRRVELGDHEPAEGYLEAVAHTCRWMAALPMRTALCGGQARSPVRLRGWPARADLIEAEWQAAQRAEEFLPELAARPGWCDGVRATLRWAWRREGPPPLPAAPVLSAPLPAALSVPGATIGR